MMLPACKVSSTARYLGGSETGAPSWWGRSWTQITIRNILAKQSWGAVGSLGPSSGRGACSKLKTRLSRPRGKREAGGNLET